MSKKRTRNKQLEIKDVPKEEAVKIPNTVEVEIIFLENGKHYTKSHQVATILINSGKAKLK